MVYPTRKPNEGSRNYCYGKTGRDKVYDEELIKNLEFNSSIKEVVVACMLADLINNPAIKFDIQTFGTGIFINGDPILTLFPRINDVVSNKLNEYNTKHKGTKMNLKEDFDIFIIIQTMKSVYDITDDTYYHDFRRYTDRLKSKFHVTKRTIDNRQNKLVEILDDTVYSAYVTTCGISLLNKIESAIVILYCVYKYFGHSDAAYIHFNKYMQEYLFYLSDTVLV